MGVEGKEEEEVESYLSRSLRERGKAPSTELRVSMRRFVHVAKKKEQSHVHVCEVADTVRSKILIRHFLRICFSKSRISLTKCTKMDSRCRVESLDVMWGNSRIGSGDMNRALREDDDPDYDHNVVSLQEAEGGGQQDEEEKNMDAIHDYFGDNLTNLAASSSQHQSAGKTIHDVISY